jgi:ArsR family transcriptional regulator
MGPDAGTVDVARRVKAIADPTRIAIIRALGSEGELCVCEVMLVIDRSQPSASHHLRILKEAGLLDEVRRGRWVFYSLADESVLGILESLDRLKPG